MSCRSVWAERKVMTTPGPGIDIFAIKRQAAELWMRLPGILGVGIHGPEALVVYVVSRDAAEAIPAIFQGAAIDVEVTGPIRALRGESSRRP